MANDLCEVTDGVIEVELKGKPQKVVLSEKDELWVKFRHRHVADCIDGPDGLPVVQAAIMAKNPNAKKQNDGHTLSTKEMGELMRAMPEYQADLERYSAHLYITQRCMKVLQAKDSELLVKVITEVEQTLATGSNEENEKLGGALKLETLIDSMLDIMSDAAPIVRLRLALTLVATQVDSYFVKTCRAEVAARPTVVSQQPLASS